MMGRWIKWPRLRMNEVMIVQIIYVFRDKEEDPPDTGELLALQQQCKILLVGCSDT